MSLVLVLLGALRAALRSRTDLTPENLALRQQLALLRRQSKRPQFGRLDRIVWIWLSTRWAGWRDALHIVRPETVIRWHRQGSALSGPGSHVAGERVNHRSALAPDPRAVEPPENGSVVAVPQVGGLHHRYVRHAV